MILRFINFRVDSEGNKTALERYYFQQVMGLLQKVNKGLDIIFKLGLLTAAFTLALLPVPFLFGNEQLHYQPVSDELLVHSSRAAELDTIKASQFSNIYLNVSVSEGAAVSNIKQTITLGDYVCYWLQQQGYRVVRKNLELSAKKKNKKSQPETLPAVTSVHTLIEEPPLRSLKSKITKYIDFEHSSVSEKYWVIVAAGELDSHFISEIKTISDRNPLYKFIIVTPVPIVNRLFKKNASDLVAQEKIQNIEPANGQATTESAPTTQQKPQVKNSQVKSKKGKGKEKQKQKQKPKKAKKQKVTVVEVAEEEPAKDDL